MQILSTANSISLPHCLIYGPPKIGKTVAAATAPKPFIFDCDQGVSSLKGTNTPYFDITTWAQWCEATKWWFESAEAKQFETLVIDDLTEVAELFLVMEKPKHKNLMQAYGQLNDEMMRLIRLYRQPRDRTTVFICKQDRIADTLTGGLIYAPMIPGKAVQQMLPYLVGEVYQMYLWTDPQGVAHRCLRTARDSTNSFDAGSRSGKLAPIEFANLTNIFNKVKS